MKEVYRADLLDSLLAIETRINKEKSSQISVYENQVSLFREKEINFNQIIQNQDAIKSTYESDIKRLKRLVYLQKLQKKIYGGLGVLTTGIFLYLYVTK